MNRCVSLLTAFFISTGTGATEPLWSGAIYNDSTPTLESVVGHEIGEEISSHAQIKAYFDALQAAHPDQVRIVPYAKSWESRDLYYVIIGAATNVARLNSIEAQIADVADGDAAASDLPGIVWLSYSVHGNEISSSDAAIATAYHLLASVDDDVVETILANTLVIIDPLQNPDGRDRFIHAFEQARGLEIQSDRIAAEHDEPWPSGRVNHYLFDLNRDWLPITQPETLGRVREVQRWRPLAFVDLHEMGSNSTYFFAPEAIPYNPHLTDSQRENLVLFGKNNAHWFDENGFDYFTREVYDAFYPGYGASWPAYHGSIAMTYEQASARGLLMRREDGSEFDYRETVQHHFVASISTAQTVAENREELWRDFAEYRRSAANRSDAPAAYVIPRQTDQGAADKLAGLLATHGIEGRRSDQSFRACGKDYPAGSVIFSTRQPASRLLRTLMDRQVDMDPDFVAEQERLRNKDLPDQIYDVTAWSLPLMFNVDVEECDRAVTVNGPAVEPRFSLPGRLVGENPEVAWLVPGKNRNTLRFLAHALRNKIRVTAAERGFSVEGREFPSGTLVIKAADAPNASTMRKLVETSGIDAFAVDDSWITEGPSLGSERVRPIVAPRVALAWDWPTSAYSAGATRYVIEQQFDYPVTPVRTSTLARADLRRYDVVILPESWGGYGAAFGDAPENLIKWVEDGGTLIALGNAAEYAASSGLSALQAEAQVREEEQKKSDDEGKPALVAGKELTSKEDYLASIEPAEEAPDNLAGVLLKAMVDPDHWLGAGIADEINVLARSDAIFAPLKLDQGFNVATFAGPEDVFVSGYGWEENIRLLAYKPFVTVEEKGRGQVIAFTHDPTVRAYLDGLNALLMSAILKGPSYASPAR